MRKILTKMGEKTVSLSEDMPSLASNILNKIYFPHGSQQYFTLRKKYSQNERKMPFQNSSRNFLLIWEDSSHYESIRLSWQN